MSLVIVTGLSGAGKSRVMDILEDVGYYCADNLPPMLVPTFLDLLNQSSSEEEKVALAVDIRSKELFSSLATVLDSLDEAGTPYSVLFLECSDEELKKRFALTRRQHPLAHEFGGDIDRAIAKERKALGVIRDRANFVVDTTSLEAGQLKSRVSDLLLDNASSVLKVYCESFGFKHGLPSSCDLLFDVRCLPNPYYLDELRNKTGFDSEVVDYVMSFDQSQVLLAKLCDLVDYLYPLYVEEGKSQLTIAIGCSGGHHRSVTFARKLAEHLRQQGKEVYDIHRDLEK